MVKIEEHLAKVGTACRSGEKLHDFIGVTIHETANKNKGAGALNHAKYLQGSGANKAASWHYCVDDELTTRSIPEDEVAWHSGKAKGNYNTIAVEICVNSDGNFQKAVLNAAELTADILKRHRVTKENYKSFLFQHHDWSGKNCPTLLRSGKPVSWSYFVERVGAFFGDSSTSQESFKEGDSVYLTGYLYANSYASKRGKYFTNRLCKITRIVDLHREAPYLLDSGLGWVKKSDIRKA